MKIIFFGNGEFSVKVLEKLNQHYRVNSVVTTPDKKQGRGQQLVEPMVKVFAKEHNIEFRQFVKVSVDGIDYLKNEKPDIIVTAAFGQILSRELLSIPKIGVLNVHGSILPKYRGASPIQSAIINGDKETGITIMRTVYELDAGDILLQKKLKIEDLDTSSTMFEKLAVLGGECIVEAVDKIQSGNYAFVPQNNNEATYTKIIKKEDAKIDFNKTAKQVCDFIRGMYNWPVAYFEIENEKIKVYESDKRHTAGTILSSDNKKGLVVACLEDAIRLKKLQKTSGKVLDDIAFINGFKMPTAVL